MKDLNAILAQYSHIVGSHDRLGITFNSDLELNEDFGKRSAGQRKRNDIVIMLSLFELVRQRGRFRADFVMLDEVGGVSAGRRGWGKGERREGKAKGWYLMFYMKVFDALDVHGQLQVQELLAMLAERVSKVLFLSPLSFFFPPRPSSSRS